MVAISLYRLRSLMSKNRIIQSYQGNLEDVRQLRKLVDVWVEDDSFWEFEVIAESIARNFVHLLFIAGPDKSWQGAIVYQLIEQQADLIYIFVAPKFRRKGISRALMSGLIESIFVDRVPGNLNLEVRSDNAEAQKLYESMEMEICGIRKSYYEDGCDAKVYQLVIDEDYVEQL